MPYDKGLSPLQSQHRQTQGTPAETKIMNTLNFYGIDYKYQQIFKREGKFNGQGIEKSYVADFVLSHKIILEIEGEGSSSKDNEERDDFFRRLGYILIHIPNFIAIHYTYLLAQLLGIIVGTSKPEELFRSG